MDASSRHRNTIHDYWLRMEGREWSAVQALLHADFQARFPQSGERFGGAEWVAMNRAYPGDWHVRVLDVVAQGHTAISRVAVDIDGRVDVALSVFTFEGSRIARLDEYWPEPFEVPDWRTQQ